MKLKTLKDMVGIQKTDTLEVIRGKLPYAVTSYELRQEAIKWIGEFRKSQQKDKEGDKEFVKKQMVILWIKDFFNITEEDLKE